MLSNLAFSTVHSRMIESPSPGRKSPDRSLQTSQSKNILTVRNIQNSPPQVRHTDAGTSVIRKTSSKPLYVDERDDETISLLSDDDGLLLDTRFEYDENENENSGPACSFGSASQYMGGNYFFRQNSSAAENDYRDVVVSFPSEDQSDQHFQNDNKDPSHFLEGLPSPKIEESNSKSDDLQQLIEILKQEKFALSQKCSKLETLILETRHDHNCYKANMTMAMGSLRIQMESERDDKAYLLHKCQQLNKEFSALQTDYGAKLGIISVLQNQHGHSLRPMQEQKE